jgi:hypothetical protein
MSVGILVRLATERASLHHVDETRLEFELHIPTAMFGPVATLAVEGTENS